MGGYKIIFEDDYILVVDKPPGLLTIPTPKKEKNTLSSLLKAYPCHRLDRETSGLIVLAKNVDMQRIVMEQFKNKSVRKKYIAFVQGKLNRHSGTIANYVQDTHFKKAKYAITKYRLLESRSGFSVVEITPITGRTNQIRIHFKQIGHPLVGERRFAFAKDFKIKFRRVALHSLDLEFRHPVTKERMPFHSNLPLDMQEFLKTHY